MKPVRRRQSRWLSAGLACVSLWGLAACDTVALISFQNRQFANVRSSGFTATGDSCAGITDGRATMRFVMLADDDTPIRPGQTVNKQAFSSLARDQFEFNNEALFETPDNECESDSCDIGAMTCSTAPGLTGVGDRCLTQTSVTISENPQFEADVDSPQLFGVLFENAGSLGGWLPSDVGSYYIDTTGDGLADGQPDSGPIRARASDISNARRAALQVMLNKYKQAAEFARNENRTTRIGLWEFKGQTEDEVISLVNEAAPGDTVWATEASTAETAVQQFSRIEGTRANVYQAMLKVLDEGFSSSEFTSHEKTLVVFVDGPDDLNLPAFTESAVTERATELGVRIFIVHLDAAQEPTTQAGTPVHRDDPDYWRKSMAETCSDDAECRNFETCREPDAYSTSLGSSVEITSNGDTYCVPTRDPNDGRLGPIEEYARIACATDGGYIYLRDPQGLRQRFEWLPFTLDGLWKAEVTVADLANGSVPDGEAYLLQTTMSVSVSGTTKTIDFSQQGESAITDDARDSRGVLFN